MKVKIGPYKNWFGPYQLAEKILFWKDPNDPIVCKLDGGLDYARRTIHKDHPYVELSVYDTDPHIVIS